MYFATHKGTASSKLFQLNIYILTDFINAYQLTYEEQKTPP